MAQKLTVVVTGSTGKQGGAVARALFERGSKVRAVTRDPNSSPAKSLAKAGATLVEASLEDTAAIMKALKGATSLFAMTLPSRAMAAGVHLVSTSVGNANRQTGVPHFDSKYESEETSDQTDTSRFQISAPRPSRGTRRCRTGSMGIWHSL